MAVHTLALAALLAALAPFMVLDTPWVGDEGGYALQVTAIENGSWEYPYVARPIDAKGSWFPLAATAAVERNGQPAWFPYAKHPAYPAALWLVTRFKDDATGLYLLPLAGCLLTAVAAWFLAGEINTRLARPAFWIAAAGPVFINAYVLWAHTLSAGLGGVALVAAARITRRGIGLRRVAMLFSALFLGILMRSEGQLFGIALSLVLAVLLPGRRFLGSTHRLLRLCVPLGGIGVVLAARLIEHAMIGAITGGPAAADGLREGSAGAPYLAGRWTGLYQVLVQGSEYHHWASRVVAVALSLVVAAALLLRFSARSRRREAARAALIAIVFVLIAMRLYQWRFERVTYESATGIFAAWPLALLGLAGVAWRRAEPLVWMIAGTGLVFLAGVAATQYSEGGGLEWGGRFLSPMIAGVAALSAYGLVRVVGAVGARFRLAVVFCLGAILAAVPVAEGLGVVHRARAARTQVVAAVGLADASPVVVAEIGLVELPRIAWRLYPDQNWVMAPSGDADVVLERMHSAGFREVVVLEPVTTTWSARAPFPHKTEVVAPVLQAAALRMVVLRS